MKIVSLLRKTPTEGQYCGRLACKTSHLPDGTFSFGSGRLDDYGFWQRPCRICAAAFAAQVPGAKVWPTGKQGDAKN